MTRAEIIAEAKARGFTHAETMAGPLALDDWRPYGMDGGPNDTPAFPSRWHGEFIAADTVRDMPAPGRTSAAPFLLGGWTLLSPWEAAGRVLDPMRRAFYHDHAAVIASDVVRTFYRAMGETAWDVVADAIDTVSLTADPYPQDYARVAL